MAESKGPRRSRRRSSSRSASATVRISNPDRVYFPARGETKLDLVNYYLSVGDGIVRALRERPCMMHRFPTGVAGEKVHQKRLPHGAPPWMETVRVHFPRYNRTADELCVTELGQRRSGRCRCRRSSSTRGTPAAPTPRSRTSGGSTSTRCRTARSTGSAGSPTSPTRCSTSSARSGGRRRPAAQGMHIYVRIEPAHGFTDVRRAALAFAREVERRAPDDVTTTWWRKDRDPAKLFVDYNQNARDHTIARAYSVRGNPEGTVSTPIRWDEVDDVEPERLHHRDGARALRRAGRPARRDRRRRVLHRHRCWSGPTATSATAPRNLHHPRRSRRQSGSAVRIAASLKSGEDICRTSQYAMTVPARRAARRQPTRMTTALVAEPGSQLVSDSAGLTKALSPLQRPWYSCAPPEQIASPAMGAHLLRPGGSRTRTLAVPAVNRRTTTASRRCSTVVAARTAANSRPASVAGRSASRRYITPPVSRNPLSVGDTPLQRPRGIGTGLGPEYRTRR